jgi:hypothetical protein
MDKNTCPHMHVTEFITNVYMATMEDPSETVGYAECNDCGEKFDIDYADYPDNAIVKQDYTLMGNDCEPDYPLPDYPEL